jgi:hypothetical protein
MGQGYVYSSHIIKFAEIGTYYKIKNNTKIGAFLSEHHGLRHPNDWVISNGQWDWQDTSKRSEVITRLVYSKKFRHFNSPIVYNLKAEYQANSFNGQSLILLKPALHYFYMNGGSPLWSLNSAIPLYFPLNFEKNTIYKKGIYNSFLYHYSSNFLLSITHKYLVETWTESDKIKKANSNWSYEVDDITSELSLSLIFSF